jgi:hypothetical protein
MGSRDSYSLFLMQHTDRMLDSPSDTPLAKTFLYSGAASQMLTFWKFGRRGLAGDDMYPGIDRQRRPHR